MNTDPWVRFAAEAPLENFEVFLTSRQFIPVDTIGTKAVIYQSPEGASVLLPQSREFDDYVLRITELVDTLSNVLGEDRDRVSKLISSVGYDLLKIRTGLGKQSFSVDLDDALDTLHNGYALVDYSAVYAASNNPPTFIKGRRTKEVSTYLDSVRMGQTEPGSFVLTLLLPVVAKTDLVGTSDAPLSLGQKVSDTLAKGLESSRDALSAGPHTRARKRPLTANFLSALAEIVKSSPEVEIGMDQRATNFCQRVRFTRNDVEPLREMAESLTPREEARSKTLTGSVINVTEPRGQKSGFFVLEAAIDGVTKNVKVSFSRSERKRVIKAFDEKSELKLRVRGRLVRSEAGRLSLDNPVDIELRKRGTLA